MEKQELHIQNSISYEERRRVYERTIDTWGTEAQAMMAVEEMSELTKAICKLYRADAKDIPEKLRDMAEEVADVTIMCEQLRIMFDMNEDVRRFMDEKVTRLAERLGIDKPSSGEKEGSDGIEEM